MVDKRFKIIPKGEKFKWNLPSSMTNYVNLHFQNSVSYVDSIVDKNIIVSNPTPKGDSYFIVADSKTQQGDEVSNGDQHGLFQQTPLHIDCNTPEKAVLSNS